MQLTLITPAMQVAREAIAAEFQTGNTSRATVGFLPRFFASARDGLASFFSAKFDFYKATHLAVEQEKIMRKLASANFAVVAPLSVTTLEGFHGNYLDYGNTVLSGFNYYHDFTAPAILTYRKLIAEILSNKSSRQYLRDLTKNNSVAQKRSEEIDASVASFFVRGSHRAVMTVGDITTSIGDIRDVFNVSQSIIREIKSIDPSVVQNSVKEVNDLINLLVEEINEGSIEDLSGVQLNNLVECLFALARQVEFFALTYYRATTYVASVERLTDVLKKV